MALTVKSLNIGIFLNLAATVDDKKYGGILNGILYCCYFLHDTFVQRIIHYTFSQVVWRDTIANLLRTSGQREGGRLFEVLNHLTRFRQQTM